LAVRIKFDNTKNVLQPNFILANRNGNRLGKIPAYNIHVVDNFNSYFETSFKVDKYKDYVKYHLWEELTDFKLAYCKEFDVWFELYVEKFDERNIIKNISGISLGEAELSQIKVYGIEINTDDDIARDDYEVSILYSKDKPKTSILHRLMEKAPHYKIKYVASTLVNLQRSFSFDGISLYDAFNEISEELNCIFVIDSGMSEDGKPKREISVYDLESYCVDCGHREEFSSKCPKCGSDNILPGYGEDTSIFISSNNLADDITFTTDKDSVKNCFRLEAGDDLMTATVKMCNPNGSQYIWYISDEIKADMSEELSSKISEYDELFKYYANEYAMNIDESVLNAYNDLIRKYYPMNDALQTVSTPIVGYPQLMNAYFNTIDLYLYLHDAMMPSVEAARTTAGLQAAKLGYSSMSPVAVADTSKVSTASANSAVLAVAKTLVSPLYQVKVNEGILDGMVWTGSFKVTNYSDEEDTAISPRFDIVITDDFQTSIKQRLNSSLSGNSDDVTNIVTLFNLPLSEFELELKKYCQVSLSAFENMCQACLNILIENGIANDDNWRTQDVDLYTILYEPYYNKLLAIQAELKLRESELALIIGKKNSDGDFVITGLQNAIDDENEIIQDRLNFQDYLGDELWLEFAAYRRDDTYSNSNYISDGLNNVELFEKAREFLDIAQKEIFKSATLQHTISANLKNLLSMQEFQPIVEHFQVGNWLRIRIDDDIFRLRLLSYDIDYDAIEKLSVTFSDVQRTMSGLSDVQSILNQAASMGSSYDAVKRQSKKGKKSNEQLVDWVDKGLALTKLKIIDNADQQNISWDEYGLLCRRYNEFSEDYGDEQLKIINCGLYLTDDNWKTSKAGIGKFTFWNPKSEETEEAYGVIADTLVGNLILTEEIGIYNVGSSVVIDKNGLTITADAQENLKAMTIQRKEYDADGNASILPVMYIDAQGNLVLTGSVKIQAGFDSNISDINDLCNPDKFTDTIQGIVNTESQNIYSSIDGKYKDIIDKTTAQLEQYKADIGQYMTFNEDGLTLGATTSDFKTVIDNQSMRFKQGDETVAYINNNQLYIENATVKQTLMLGNFFFSPRSDGGVSLTWMGGND